MDAPEEAPGEVAENTFNPPAPHTLLARLLAQACSTNLLEVYLRDLDASVTAGIDSAELAERFRSVARGRGSLTPPTAAEIVASSPGSATGRRSRSWEAAYNVEPAGTCRTRGRDARI